MALWSTNKRQHYQSSLKIPLPSWIRQENIIVCPQDWIVFSLNCFKPQTVMCEWAASFSDSIFFPIPVRFRHPCPDHRIHRWVWKGRSPGNKTCRAVGLASGHWLDSRMLGGRRGRDILKWWVVKPGVQEGRGHCHYFTLLLTWELIGSGGSRLWQCNCIRSLGFPLQKGLVSHLQRLTSFKTLLLLDWSGREQLTDLSFEINALVI